MKTKNWFLHVFVLVIFFTIFLGRVEAHILEMDGTIGAVMHVDPEDDPVVGEPATFFFDIKDKTNKFDHLVCDCQIIISKDSHPIVQHALEAQNSDTHVLTYSHTFAEQGIYTIKVMGQPTTGVFQPFELIYDLRVSSTSMNHATATSELPWRYFAIAATILIFIALLLADRFYYKKNKRKLYTFLLIFAVTTSVTFFNLACLFNHELVKGQESHHHANSHTEHVDHPCCLPLLPELAIRFDLNPGLQTVYHLVNFSHPPAFLLTLSSIKNRSPPDTA